MEIKVNYSAKVIKTNRIRKKFIFLDAHFIFFNSQLFQIENVCFYTFRNIKVCNSNERRILGRYFWSDFSSKQYRCSFPLGHCNGNRERRSLMERRGNWPKRYGEKNKLQPQRFYIHNLWRSNSFLLVLSISCVACCLFLTNVLSM